MDPVPMVPEVADLVDRVRALVPSVTVNVDAPRAVVRGHWFVDFRHGARLVVAEYRPGQGYGLSFDEGGREWFYGEGADEVVVGVEEAAQKVADFLSPSVVLKS